jgi:hypothetical protein
MPAATITRLMPVHSTRVFALLHDYDRRLEWDTLLREARIISDHPRAMKGAVSLCVGKPMFGLIGIATRYLTFNPGVVAAVQMVNTPPFFADFAATIRHEDTADGSLISYKFHFSAKPRWLRWILEPIMLRRLRSETERRLDALATFLGAEKAP